MRIRALSLPCRLLCRCVGASKLLLQALDELLLFSQGSSQSCNLLIGAVFVDVHLVADVACTGGVPQRIEALLSGGHRRRHTREHDCLAVASQGILQAQCPVQAMDMISEKLWAIEKGSQAGQHSKSRTLERR